MSGEIKIEDIPMSDAVKSKVIKERLPDEIFKAMEDMEDGQSFFLSTDAVQKKLYALRSRYSRWKNQNPDDLHKFSFVKSVDDNGQEGIRVYKYIAETAINEDNKSI